MRTALFQLTSAAGWSPDDFKHALGIDQGRTLRIKRELTFSDHEGAFTDDKSEDNGSLIRFYDPFNGENRPSMSWLFVHEIAHAWDNAARALDPDGRGLSDKMKDYTGSTGDIEDYSPSGQTVSEGARHNKLEDFAESVTQAVYGAGNYGQDPMSPERSQFVSDSFAFAYEHEGPHF